MHPVEVRRLLFLEGNIMNRDPLPSISLYCSKDGADKEYHAQIITVEGGFCVKTRYGKRGAAKEPKGALQVLTLLEATKKFDSIIKDKTSAKKGYTQNLSGAGYATSEITDSMSGNLPHLLVPITYDHLVALASDDDFWFQEKIDGERLMIDKKNAVLKTSNKLGQINTISHTIVDPIRSACIEDVLLDGENKNGSFYVFDVLRLNGQCLKSKPFSERYAIAQTLDFGDLIHLVKCHQSSEQKHQFLLWAKHQNGNALVEGVVAKNKQATYISGRAKPSEATQYKYKFIQDASFIVIDVAQSKRSVTLGLYGNRVQLNDYGNVGVPVNQQMPAIGDVIDVQFRHWFKNGALCQPVFLKPRTDVLAEECIITQFYRVKSNTPVDPDDED